MDKCQVSKGIMLAQITDALNSDHTIKTTSDYYMTSVHIITNYCTVTIEKSGKAYYYRKNTDWMDVSDEHFNDIFKQLISA